MMRRLLTAITAIAACVLAVACSQVPGGSTGPVGQPTPRHLEPQPGMNDTQPVPWEYAKVGDDGRTLEVVWSSGPEPCSALDRVEVVESAEVVTVTLYEGRPPDLPSGALCPAILVRKATTVVLDAPLGDRKLVDGAPRGA